MFVVLTIIAAMLVRMENPEVAPLAVLKTEGKSVNSLAFSLDGKMMAVASPGGDVELWDVRSHQRSFSLRRTFAVCSVAFNNDASSLATAGDGMIRAWDMRTHQPAKVCEDSTACVLAL